MILDGLWSKTGSDTSQALHNKDSDRQIRKILSFVANCSIPVSFILSDQQETCCDIDSLL